MLVNQLFYVFFFFSVDKKVYTISGMFVMFSACCNKMCNGDKLNASCSHRHL